MVRRAGWEGNRAEEGLIFLEQAAHSVSNWGQAENSPPRDAHGREDGADKVATGKRKRISSRGVLMSRECKGPSVLDTNRWSVFGSLPNAVSELEWN
jgi:hypothetical protein